MSTPTHFAWVVRGVLALTGAMSALGCGAARNALIDRKTTEVIDATANATNPLAIVYRNRARIFVDKANGLASRGEYELSERCYEIAQQWGIRARDLESGVNATALQETTP